MRENPELLRLCLEAPDDDARLLVYADWLEQEGDPRAAYTRAQLELKRSASRSGRPARLATLRALYPLEHPAWCGRLEQTGVFVANLLEVEERWWGVGLGPRETMATYQPFPYHRQPPLPVERFDGTFAWLRTAPSTEADVDPDDGAWPGRLAELRSHGFNVPALFDRFIVDADLHRRVPSCTDNFFLGGAGAEVHPLGDDACFLTFYSDSQSCVVWGLRLGKGADRVAPVLAGVPEHPDEEPPEGQPYFRFPQLTFCAPTLETFVYRWWLENTIWFATEWEEGQRDLTPDERAYLAHLERR